MEMLAQFTHVYLIDFEYCAPDGENPDVVCMVCHELHSGQTTRLWQDELEYGKPPFDLGDSTLFVAYYAIAEASSFLALGWPLPQNMLDLFTEFRCLTNGKYGGGNSLLGALQYYNLPSIEAMEKESMRDLIMRGGERVIRLCDELEEETNPCVDAT